MAATTLTNVTAAEKTAFELGLLGYAKGRLVVDKFGDSKVVGSNEASKWRFLRLLRPSAVTSAATAGTRVAGSSATNLVANYIEITPELWQGHFGFDDNVEYRAVIKDAEYRERIGNHMARSLDARAMAILATQCLRCRVDRSATYQEAVTCTGSPSATALESSAFTSTTNDFWGGSSSSVGYATIINPEGPGYDETSQITDYVGATKVATVAFTNALTTASRARAVIGTGLTAANVMTVDSLIGVRADHDLLETELFEGNTLKMFLHSNQHYDLQVDPVWRDAAVYSQPGTLANYEVFRIAGIEGMVSSSVYREGADGIASATGAVYVAPIFGKHAYVMKPWGHGSGKYGSKFYYVTEPDSENLTMNEWYVSWKAHFGMKVTRATSIVGLMTGATDRTL